MSTKAAGAPGISANNRSNAPHASPESLNGSISIRQPPVGLTAPRLGQDLTVVCYRIVGAW